MSSEVKLYDPCETMPGAMRECEEGGFCQASDYAALEAENARLKEHVLVTLGMQECLAKERDALRAELAEVKGREAVPVAWRVSVAGEWEIGTDREKVQFQRDLFERVMSDETEHEEAEPLYASPPALPDVEGLVKALEEISKASALLVTEQYRKLASAALSTWRPAQEGKA
jgi:hypothetical protein